MTETDLRRVLATIDAVTAAACGWCQKPLRGPSMYFCGSTCQERWHAHGNALTPAGPGFQRQDVGAALAEVVPSFMRALREVGNAVRSVAEHFALYDAGESARARALRLRRTRNTGPAPVRRAAARIDPTRGR